MRATFYGFETIRKALNASQKGLDVTGQNISNVNVEGYARQRLDLTSIAPDNGTYKYARTHDDLVGQGVDVVSVTQIRNQFLDARYWKENSSAGQFDATVVAMTDIENILDESTTDGLHARFNDFYQKLNEFAKNPESVEFATIFRTSASKVTEIFHQYMNSFEAVKSEQIGELGIAVSDINNIAKKLASVNQQIKSEQIQGSVSNELKDMRNLLIDNLSTYTNLTLEPQASGTVAIKIGDTYLIDPDNNVTNMMMNESDTVDVVWDDGTSVGITTGSIKANLDILNGTGSTADGDNPFKGIPYYVSSLNQLASVFAETFNTINGAGEDKPLFSSNDGAAIDANNISISSEWQTNARYVTNSTKADPAKGDNDNIMRMINAMQQNTDITSSFSGTFEEYAVALSSDIAIDKNFYVGMQESTVSVLTSIQNQRESIMGVSLDEEAANMLKYQKSYNAAARLMTVLDEALDTIINRMGIVGR